MHYPQVPKHTYYSPMFYYAAPSGTASFKYFLKLNLVVAFEEKIFPNILFYLLFSVLSWIMPDLFSSLYTIAL